MTTPARTLGDLLKVAGVASVAPATATTTPAGTASPDAVKAAAAKAAAEKAAAEKAAAEKAAAEKAAADKAAAEKAAAEKAAAEAAPVTYDPAIIKTAAQKALLDRGILIPDPVLAEQVFKSKVAEAQAAKVAELQKFAAEHEARGVLQYHGMLKESTAMGLATGEITPDAAIKTAAMIGVDPAPIFARAAEMRKQAELASAAPHSAFFGGAWATPARPGSSAVTAAAERNGATTEFRPEAAGGTRAPTSGMDAALVRFTESATLPGNPGLNHGQQVDHGKGG